MLETPAGGDPVSTLLAALELSPVPGPAAAQQLPEVDDVFTAASLPRPGGRIYGGQVLAQALLAAALTVADGRLPHSLHGYFLRPGDVSEPVVLQVERLNDGRSFSARRTHALQFGKPILSMIASFQEEHPGLEYAEQPPSAALPPLEVPSSLAEFQTLDDPLARFWTRESAFDIRHQDGSLYLGPAATQTGRQMVWMRARRRIEAPQAVHRALLAYACDQVMLEPVLRATGNHWLTKGLSVASLDHAMWWHRDVQVDEWLLFTQNSPSAQGGRGLGAARVFDEHGRLVASVAQEGMVRVPSADA